MIIFIAKTNKNEPGLVYAINFYYNTYNNNIIIHEVFRYITWLVV